MASFISTLSFLVLVLFNGIFTLPIIEDQTSSVAFAFASGEDGVTTEVSVNLRSVPDDETTVLPESEKRFTDEHMGFEVSTSVNQKLRTVDESSTLEPSKDKPDYDYLAYTTIEPTTESTEYERRGIIDELQNEKDLKIEFTTNNPVSTTSTVIPESDKTNKSTGKFTSYIKVTKEEKLKPKYTNEKESKRKPEKDEDEKEEKFKSEAEDEKEENIKSKYADKKESKRKPQKNDDDEKEEDEKESKPKSKNQYKSKPKHDDDESKEKNKHDESEETEKQDRSEAEPSETKKVKISTKNPSIATAVLDQEALKNLAKIPNDFLILDEKNDDIAVTDLPEKLVKSPMKQVKQDKPLNQGKKPSHVEEKESDH